MALGSNHSISGCNVFIAALEFLIEQSPILHYHFMLINTMEDVCKNRINDLLEDKKKLYILSLSLTLSLSLSLSHSYSLLCVCVNIDMLFCSNPKVENSFAFVTQKENSEQGDSVLPQPCSRKLLLHV
ncbi:hypothetical protein NE237_006303 [Protea cynaroides]|uniref:Uncharacterized protein n=1 Tax=Protea cynaroides TaxID=273540 RepID=A0A9Q0KMC2_9MAGN|nr:hypothetical protein NE237_006303 [Protea cynaroides]